MGVFIHKIIPRRNSYGGYHSSTFETLRHL